MPVRMHVSGLVSWVVIDRPERANSLDYEHLSALASALGEACSRDDASVVAIRGSGSRFFSAGLDLYEAGSLGGTGEAARLILEGVGGVMEGILRCGKPVVAAVNGDAYGLAFEIVQASDLAYAVETARLGVPALRWGLIPPYTPVVCPGKRASELLYTGRILAAGDALEAGFLNGVAGDLDGLERLVRGAAERVAEADPEAIRLVKTARYTTLWPQVRRGLELMALTLARESSRRRITEAFPQRRGSGR